MFIEFNNILIRLNSIKFIFVDYKCIIITMNDDEKEIREYTTIQEAHEVFVNIKNKLINMQLHDVIHGKFD